MIVCYDLCKRSIGEWLVKGICFINIVLDIVVLILYISDDAMPANSTNVNQLQWQGHRLITEFSICSEEIIEPYLNLSGFQATVEFDKYTNIQP